jgi:tripartite-type tricarboxylate transporter receptor subunit TctC
MLFLKRCLNLVGLALALWLAAGTLHAQEQWPAKPVKVIVPSSPGGGTDVFARLLAQQLSDQTKQQFVVDNRPGASGNIGAQVAVNSPKDGYTFLIASNSSTAINLWLHKDLTFDVRKDLVPVARGVYAISTLIVNNDLPAKTLSEFIALAKSKPDSLVYGTPGTGSAPYLGVRMMEEVAGLKFIHAPYKGIGPAYQDLIAGRLQFIFADLASALSFVQSGKVRALAVDRKTPLLPNVPTFTEAGMPKFDSPIAFSVLAPAGVPQPIIAKMAVEVGKALKAIAPRLEQQAYVPVYDTPAEFGASLDRERAMWGDFVKRNAITAEQ